MFSFILNFFKPTNRRDLPSDVDNVNIDRDGIVSLDLDNRIVQQQLLAQIKELKTYESELKHS